MGAACGSNGPLCQPWVPRLGDTCTAVAAQPPRWMRDRDRAPPFAGRRGGQKRSNRRAPCAPECPKVDESKPAGDDNAHVQGAMSKGVVGWPRGCDLRPAMRQQYRETDRMAEFAMSLAVRGRPEGRRGCGVFHLGVVPGRGRAGRPTEPRLPHMGNVICSHCQIWPDDGILSGRLKMVARGRCGRWEGTRFGQMRRQPGVPNKKAGGIPW